MSLIGAKPTVVREDVIYAAQTKLAELSDQITKARKINSSDLKPKIKQAKQIVIWLEALEYINYLTREQSDKIVYALIDIADINDYPTAPLLSVQAPNIIIGGSTTTTVVNQSGGGSGIEFTNTDVDTGIEVVDTFARTLSTGAEWTYTARKNDGTSQKSGRVIGTWLADGSDVEYEHDSTIFAGVGSPSDITLAVVHNAGNIELRATSLSDNWTVEGFRNHIPPTDSEASVVVSAIEQVIGGNLKTTTIPITNWNMVSSTSKSVAHGISNWQSIRVLDVMIFKDDASSPNTPLNSMGGVDEPNGAVVEVNTTNIVLIRASNGISDFFDSGNYDGTGIRGRITVMYED